MVKKPVKKKTDFLFGSALVENLLPKKYQVEINKEGFYSWIKDLEVIEKRVTEAKGIVLIPRNLNFETVSLDEKEINDILSEIDAQGKEERADAQYISIEISGGAKSYTLSGNQVIWLDKKGGLYRSYLRDSFSKINVAYDVKNFRLSPDSRKIVYFNNYEIWILYLDYYNTSQKEAGEEIFLTRFSEKIDDVFWLNSDYLIFSVGNAIKISEIDDRDRINAYDIAEFKNPEIFWDKNSKKLYVLSEGNLFISEKLLP